MRRIALWLMPSALIGLSACSSVGVSQKNDKPVMTKSAGLAQQNLEEGECAAFLWAANGKREFIYFQKQDSNTAQYYRDNETIVITTTDNTSNLTDAGTINFDYTGQSGETVIVTGGYSGEIEGGLKIAPATIKLQTKDGWEKITPASGVFACL